MNVIVTGASRGIGRGIATQWHFPGAVAIQPYPGALSNEINRDHGLHSWQLMFISFGNVFGAGRLPHS